jgi:hypothetical protein
MGTFLHLQPAPTLISSVDWGLKELYRAAAEEPFAPPAILANIARLSGWDDPPDVVIVTPVAGKGETEGGGYFLGKPNGTGALILDREPTISHSQA